MQQHHLAVLLAEQHPRDTALRERAAHFPQSPAQWPAQRHADRPSKLDVLNVLADDLAVVVRKAVEPFADGFAARRQGVEKGGKSFQRHLTGMYHFWYANSRAIIRILL